MIYADFKIVLVPAENGKQNPEKSYRVKYEKLFACGYVNKLVRVHGKFSKPFKSYLGEDALYYFINSIIKENKYCK